jgi:hypothetical protein
MNKRGMIFVMVGIMLFTFCTAPPANAIVPALAWAVWGIATGITGIAVVADRASDREQVTANNQGEDVNDLGISELPHPIAYYELGSPTPAGYVHGVEVADSPCVKC